MRSPSLPGFTVPLHSASDNSARVPELFLPIDSHIGERMEESAKAGDAEAITTAIDELEAFLATERS